MGINFNKRIPLCSSKHCSSCGVDFPNDYEFCKYCGQKLKAKKGNVYANIGKNGVSSISVKSGKMTINSKGKVSIPIAPGISYTSSTKKK